MNKKPQIHVDAVILIDIWSPFSMVSIISVADGPNAFAKYSYDEWLDYQTVYQEKCHSFLQNFKFDTLINATYRTSDAPTFSREKVLTGEDQDAEFTPMHYKHYICNPRKKMYAECKLEDVSQFVPPGGTIIVGGGSWGACSHFRPVGMVRLIEAGYRVFTAPQLCYSFPVHVESGTRNTGIHFQDMLLDDIVWSRCNIKGYFYDFLFEGLMVHNDNALDRTNRDGVAHRDAPG